MRERAKEALWGLTALAIAAGLVGVVVFVVGTIAVRAPYWGEAEVLFEASRLRERLPLFVDPIVGAPEHGLPPSRFYVTYPPLLSALVSLVPERVATISARVVACVAWASSLFVPALGARRECRPTALAAAGFVLGSWVLVNFASTARPDSLACACAALGLARSMRRGRIDALSAVLLALAPCIKPNIVGLPAGAFLLDLARHRRPWSGLLGAAVVATVVGVLYVASDGALFAHLSGGMGQPLSFAVWLDRVPSRLPFFAPLFAVALWHGWRERRESGVAIGLGALAVSLGWVLLAIAKTGSAANYWMEPSVAAVAILARAPGPFVFGRSSLLHAALALAAVLYAESASVPASAIRLRGYRREAAFLASARTRCGAAETDLVAAGDPGLELTLDRRVLVTTYQMAWAVHFGKFPAALWVSDLESPNVRCYVRHGETTAAAPEVERAIDRLFERVAVEGELELLRKR